MISPNTLASRPTVRKWAPTPRQEETHKTGVWLCRLPAETLAPYAGQWLAAYDCEIVASAPTRGENCTLGSLDGDCASSGKSADGALMAIEIPWLPTFLPACSTSDRKREAYNLGLTSLPRRPYARRFRPTPTSR